MEEVYRSLANRSIWAAWGGIFAGAQIRKMVLDKSLCAVLHCYLS
jgi:hypothetical protein